MKIKSVEIYGYGQFVQRKVEFNENFTEIYGENEAGKSTLQAFIHSILFGFPTKRENEPRLEPRMGNHYGGRVTLKMDDGSLVDVERVKGRAQGDVKVFLPNGAIKDETWLQQNLNFINKRTYQDIFSFSVMGLQDIHQNMNEQQLQNYLMQAGALGSTEFIGMRDLIHQKKQALYKKSGQNPQINRQVEELKQLEAQIRDESAKLETYQRLTDERDKAARRLEHVKTNLNQLTGFFETKQKEIALHDQVQEWKGLEADLNVEPLEFPEQGIDRYENAKFQTEQLKRDIGLRNEKYQQLSYENEQLYIPSDELSQSLENIAKKEESIKQTTMDLRQTEREIEHTERQIDGLMSNIGWQAIDSDIDTSDIRKSDLSDALKEKRDLNYAVQQLQQNYESMEVDQQSSQTELEELKSQLVSEENFAKKKEYDKRALELREKKNLFSKMKEAFETEQLQKEKQQKSLRIAMIILAVISVGLAVFSFVSQTMLFAIVFAVLAVIFVIGCFAIKTKTEGHTERFSDEINQLEKEVARLEQEYDLNFDLADQYQLRDQIHQREQQFIVLNTKQKHIAQQLEASEADLQQVSQKLTQAKAEMHVSEKLSDDLLIDAMMTIHQIKEHHAHLQTLVLKQQQLTQSLNAFYDEAQKQVTDALPETDNEALFHDVRAWVSRTNSNRVQHERNQEQMTLLEKELKHLTHRLNENKSIIQKLFNFIGAIDEESYYRHHDNYQTYHQRLSRFNDLTKYLENQNYGYEESSKLSEKTSAQLQDDYDKLSTQIDDYNQRYLTLQSEVSDLNAQINHMETDDTLRHLRHRYQLLRNQLNATAEDWAALSYLEALVDEHIKQIKDKRLPQVVDVATQIYHELTAGQYIQVTYQNEQVMVKHRDGQMYQPIELSQSTKELLYISLRLSLIKILKPYYSLPIIIDDAFVHFDVTRRQRMMKFLRALTDAYQVLYFTCAKDNHIPSKQLVTLEKIEKH
ncbi:DNA repair protein Rad50 [Staphylococcus agnetis]|uniref:ATP-binding protein n=1 Tax=Staphylococcus agnetis TaxID=985762 RepID=UPI000D19B2C8|nr:AAA family ATPase [Staphylococcus agnetis]PTH32649.1 DNA repair protein Rad50 [Staphylococcus agnetis]